MRFLTALKFVLASSCLVTAAGPALAAPSHLGWTQITALSGGWTDPHMRVVTSGAFLNPDGCPFTDGYIIDATMSGATLLQSMLLTAFATGAEIQLTVDGCVLSRPRVISVDIRRPSGI